MAIQPTEENRDRLQKMTEVVDGLMVPILSLLLDDLALEIKLAEEDSSTYIALRVQRKYLLDLRSRMIEFQGFMEGLYVPSNPDAGDWTVASPEEMADYLLMFGDEDDGSDDADEGE